VIRRRAQGTRRRFAIRGCLESAEDGPLVLHRPVTAQLGLSVDFKGGALSGRSPLTLDQRQPRLPYQLAESRVGAQAIHQPDPQNAS
jgi:hypothetical protein